jgi:hypothetical protein
MFQRNISWVELNIMAFERSGRNALCWNFAQNIPLERRVNHLYRLPTNCSAGTNDNLPDTYGVPPANS